MEVTEVRVALRENPARPERTEERVGERRLKAYATVTLDRCFIVRHIKIIEGKSGLFVAMPSHKPKAACTHCHFMNDFGARFCIQCGNPMSHAVEQGSGGTEPIETQAHRDIAHPITAEFRHYLQEKVLEAYETELAKTHSHLSGSVGTVDEAI